MAPAQSKQLVISIPLITLVLGGMAAVGFAALAVALVIESSIVGRAFYLELIVAFSLALMLACGLLTGGGLIGALFALPRTINVAASREGFDGAARPVYQVNTNLEHASDWLTKILIGAGLVMLPALAKGEYNLPQLVILEGAPPSWNATLTAITIMYFGSTGLLGGYLIGRLFTVGNLTWSNLLEGINIAFELPVPSEGHTISSAQRQALEPLLKVDPSLLRDDEQRRAWARAQAAIGNLLKAEKIYEELMHRHPDDEELILERFFLLTRTGRMEEAKQLMVRLEQLNNAASETLPTISLAQMSAYLYEPPPDGFGRVIKIGEKLTKRLFKEPRLWVYLGCAYGQKHAYGTARNYAAAELAGIQERALYCIRQALDLDPVWRSVLRSLWDRNAVKLPGENDLESFFNDERFRSLFEPEAAAIRREHALVEDFGRNLVSRLVPAQLAKFSGFVDVRISDDSGNFIPLHSEQAELRHEQAYVLVVEILQGESPTVCGVSQRIDVSEGQDRKEVDFELNPDSTDIRFVPDKASVVVPREGPPVQCRFQFAAPPHLGRHEIWVAIAQGRTTIQIVQVNIAVV